MKKIDPIALQRIVSEIEEELKRLDEIFADWESHRYGEWQDTFFRRGKGSIFHDFYCGVENIFRRIAAELNGGLPNGPAWHATLLKNMQLQIKDVRPAVVSNETAQQLKTFLDFRHKFRNIYGIDLEFDKLEELDELYPEAHKSFYKNINKFIEFMEALIKDIKAKG